MEIVTRIPAYYIVKFTDSGKCLGRYSTAETLRAVPAAFAYTYDSEAAAAAALATYPQEDGIVVPVYRTW